LTLCPAANGLPRSCSGLLFDNNNCGVCGRKCPGGTICTIGICKNNTL
jgi:hypothetical protein